MVVLDEKDDLLFAGIGRTGWFPRACAVTLEEGLAQFDRAIELNPQDARAFVARANIHFIQGANSKAIVDYDEAIRLDPSDPEPFRWRGWAWKRNGDDVKALADLNEAIRLLPSDASAWRIRGAVYSAQKNFKECRANYDRAVELAPFDADVFNHRAVLLSRCTDEAFRDGLQGVKDGIRACELGNWKPPHYVANLAAAIIQAGDSKEATAIVDSALEKAPLDARSKIEQAVQLHLRQSKTSNQK